VEPSGDSVRVVEDTPVLKECKFWPRGTCKNGDECVFLHVGDFEQMVSPWKKMKSQDEATEEAKPPAKKQKTIEEEKQEVKVGQVRIVELPGEAVVMKECKFWPRGTCKNGDNCAFQHIGDVEQTVSPWKRKLDDEGQGAAPPAKRMKTDQDGEEFDSSLEEIPLTKMVEVDTGAATKKVEKETEAPIAEIETPVATNGADKHGLDMIDLDLCLQTAVLACKSCGERVQDVKDYQNREEELQILEEEFTNILASAIATEYPLHTIISKHNIEDHTDISPAPTWFVCPIEGVDNFLRGSPLVCVTIGLCVEKKPVLGVIYNPILGQLYAARRGGGAFYNESEESSQLTNKTEMEEAVITSEYWGSKTRIKSTCKLKGFRATGSFNQNFLDVMLGVSDAGFQEDFEGPWSVCAGVTIIQEAGGVVTDLNGKIFELSLDRRSLAYGPKELVKQLLCHF